MQLKNRLALALIGTTMMTVPAFAQTTAPTSPPAAAPSESSAPAAAAAPTSTPRFVTTERANDWRGSKLVGVDVWGSENSKVGDISELIMDRSGSVSAVVISIGGFMGIGSKTVAVPFSALTWVDEAPRSASSSDGVATNRSSTSGPPPMGGSAAPASSTSADAGSSSTTHRGYPDHAVISMSQDELKNAPDFRYADQAASSTAR